METEQAIYEDFEKHGLTWCDAIGRLERIGYELKDAEALVSEWADELDVVAWRDFLFGMKP